MLLTVLVVCFLLTTGEQLPALGRRPLAVIALPVLVGLAATAVPVGGPRDRRAIGMTTAVRSLSLALFFAAPMEGAVVVAVLAYGLLMYVLSVPLAVRLGRSAV